MLPVAGAIARIPYYSHGGMSGFMAGWLCWIAYVATAPIEVSAVCSTPRTTCRGSPRSKAATGC